MHSINGYKSDLTSSDIIGEVIYNDTTHHHALHSNQNYKPGDVVTVFSAASLQDHADRYTVQKNEKEHIVLSPDYLKYMNHSCDPNCYIDIDHFQLIAIKPISKGDEFSFFYPSTEWDMAEPFHCHCNTNKCLKEIQGAAHINPSVLETYKLSTFILNKIKAH